jgi:hypothetical protein
VLLATLALPMTTPAVLNWWNSGGPLVRTLSAPTPLARTASFCLRRTRVTLTDLRDWFDDLEGNS